MEDENVNNNNVKIIVSVIEIFVYKLLDKIIRVVLITDKIIMIKDNLSKYMYEFININEYLEDFINIYIIIINSNGEIIYIYFIKVIVNRE